jgi:hypothetical protein
MSKSPLFGFCSAATLAGMVLMSLADAAVPATSPARVCRWLGRAQPGGNRQAAAGRAKQLEQTANEVARLSPSSATMLSEVMPLVGPHVIIRVQLERRRIAPGARAR